MERKNRTARTREEAEKKISSEEEREAEERGARQRGRGLSKQKNQGREERERMLKVVGGRANQTGKKNTLKAARPEKKGDHSS